MVLVFPWRMMMGSWLAKISTLGMVRLAGVIREAASLVGGSRVALDMVLLQFGYGCLFRVMVLAARAAANHVCSVMTDCTMYGLITPLDVWPQPLANQASGTISVASATG